MTVQLDKTGAYSKKVSNDRSENSAVKGRTDETSDNATDGRRHKHDGRPPCELVTLVPERENEEEAWREGTLEKAEDEAACDERRVVLDETVSEDDGTPSDDDSREHARGLDGLHDCCPERLKRDVGNAMR